MIRKFDENKYILSEVDLVEVRLILETYIVEIFGLVPPEKESESSIDAIIKLLLEVRGSAKKKQDWETADKIREGLNKLNIEIQDKKDDTTWNYIS